MHRKINNFLWMPIFLITRFCACKMDKKPANSTAPVEPASQSPVLLAITDGKVLTSDSTTLEIPHHSDTAYTIFYCVRHAEKRKDQGDNPDLTPEGAARAERLGVILKNEKLDKVFSTNYKRTVQTAEAVRKQADKIPAGATYPPAMQDAWLEETLKTGSGGHFLVVGHQNTVPKLLNLLQRDSTFQNIPDDDHGRFYIAVTKGIGQSEVIELRY
jgi:phosphohistidine phosphatase SixA